MRQRDVTFFVASEAAEALKQTIETTDADALVADVQAFVAEDSPELAAVLADVRVFVSVEVNENATEAAAKLETEASEQKEAAEAKRTR